VSSFFDRRHEEAIDQLERQFCADPQNYELVAGTEKFLDFIAQKKTHSLLATMSMGERARGIIKHFGLMFDEGTFFK